MLLLVICKKVKIIVITKYATFEANNQETSSTRKYILKEPGYTT